MNDIQQLLQSDLLPDEKIVWSGQPVAKTFTRADGFLVPFSVLWGGFAIFWEFGAVRAGAPGFFALFGIPFVLIGLYFIFGRFIYKNYKKKHTYYVVTTTRVIVLTATGNRKINAVYINQIPTINKSIGSDGIGTIIFGNSNMMTSMYGNTGMDFFASQYGVQAPTFYDVSDADQVYQTVSQAMQTTH